jgi:hypothetical protein
VSGLVTLWANGSSYRLENKMVFRAGSDLKKGRIMHKTAIVFGLLLIGNGVYGYTGGEVVSVTALIPAFVGAVILLCGIGAGLKPGRVNMILMHIAALVGLLGTLAAGGRLISTLSKEDANRFSQLNLGIMAVLCAGFLFLCFQSFRAAGRARREAAAASQADGS